METYQEISEVASMMTMKEADINIPLEALFKDCLNFISITDFEME